jgi:hypothetical protein
MKRYFPGILHLSRLLFSKIGCGSLSAYEEVVRAYIRDQEKEDHRVEQLKLF